MKNMKKIFSVSAVLFGLAMFFLAAFSFPASAEPERYDFLQLAPREESISFASALTSAKSAALRGEEARQNARKANEAKRKTIAALFRRHNKKLSEAQARNYTNYIFQACEKFNQDPFVIAAIVVNESSARAEVISRGGDYGLMQVRWRVHQKVIRAKYPHIAKAKDMLNPENNVLVGTEIFSDCRKRADNSVNGALLRYSAGNKRLAKKVLADISRLERSYQEYLKNG